MTDILIEAADRLDYLGARDATAKGDIIDAAARWLRDVAERHKLADRYLPESGAPIGICACVLPWPCPDRLSAEAFARVVLGKEQT